jgi:hypothetical protein
LVDGGRVRQLGDLEVVEEGEVHTDLMDLVAQHDHPVLVLSWVVEELNQNIKFIIIFKIN